MAKANSNKSHGLSTTRAYIIWQGMIARCYTKRNPNFPYYGGIGRFVCQRWRNSVEAFVADMGQPSDLHTLDRIDTNGSYTCGKCDECAEKQQPANCRWETDDVQHRNQKSNRYYTHEGQTLILKDWARIKGIDYHALHSRIERGWTFEESITVPTEIAKFSYNGESMTLLEWSQKTGMGLSTLMQRMSRGATFEQAISKPLRRHFSRP